MIMIGGDLLVGEAVFLADHFELRLTLVGVILALGTAAPEMSVALAASRQKLNGMVIGNAVGSVLTNSFLVLGVAALIDPVNVSPPALRFAIPFLIGVTVLLVVFKRTGMVIQRLEGALLCCLYMAFIIGFILVG